MDFSTLACSVSIEKTFAMRLQHRNRLSKREVTQRTLTHLPIYPPIDVPTHTTSMTHSTANSECIRKYYKLQPIV
jgi:hypothetical protein